MLNKKSLSTTKEFYQYETVPLKVYHDIATDGKLELLQLNGNADLENCALIWDEIIKRNAEENKSNKYSTFLNNNKSQLLYASKYIAYKAMIYCLYIDFDEALASELTKNGYKIDINPEGYLESLRLADIKVENLMTKVNAKKNEIALSMLGPEAQGKVSYSDMVVNLNFSLGWAVPNGILLCEYNGYQKQLRAKANSIKSQMPRK